MTAFELAGFGVRVTMGALAWVAFAVAIVICAPFMVLGWAAFQLGWVE